MLDLRDGVRFTPDPQDVVVVDLRGAVMIPKRAGVACDMNQLSSPRSFSKLDLEFRKRNDVPNNLTIRNHVPSHNAVCGGA